MRQWGLLLAVAGGLVAGAFVGGAPAAPAVAPTFNLVASPKCANGEKNVGRACVNPIATLADKWTYGDGNAKWDVPGQWVSTYEWTVPGTVPAAGANLTMKLSATERIGGPNNRICPAMGAASGFGLQGAQPQSLGFCAEAGGTVTQSKTLKMVASPAQPPGSLLYLSIGLQDGPHYTYTYKGAAAKPLCKRLRRAASAVAPAAAVACSYQVKFIFTAAGVPKDAPRRVLDVRIAGTGTGTLEADVDSQGKLSHTDFTLKSARVVLERDYYTNDGGRGTQRLVFAGGDAPAYVGGNTEGNLVMTARRLALTASNDPACDERHGGKQRTADLGIVDRGNAGGDDYVTLTVGGCAHHQYTFRGVKRVKVAISIR